MFDIKDDGDGTIRLSGRLDAAEVENVRAVFDRITQSAVIDFDALDYISSAGLGVLLSTQKRLGAKNESLKLINMNRHIREIFRIAGFDRIFGIE